MASIPLPAPADRIDLISAAHQHLLHQPEFQFDFGAPAAPLQPPSWIVSFLRYVATLRPIFEILFWTAIGLLGVVVLYFVAREVFRYRRRATPVVRRSKPNLPDWRPSAPHARALLEDADRLAAQGKFPDAVHLLLFRSIDDIDERHPRMLQPCLTTRDIAGISVLPSSARTAFARIAAVVERGFFGGRAIDGTDFIDCRHAYEEFAFSANGATPTAPIMRTDGS